MDYTNKNNKSKKLRPGEEEFNTRELSNLKCVTAIYKGVNKNYFKVTTEVKILDETLITLFFSYDNDFYIDCPQEIVLKFITDDAMYVSIATLREYKQVNNTVYFYIAPPEKMIKQQNRRYPRIDIVRNCFLIVHDSKGNCSTYLSKTVNISASGVLINNLETVFSDDIVSIEPSQYDCYHLVIYLEHDVVLKIFARYVRHDNVNGIDRYGFHFLNMKVRDLDIIRKLVSDEQKKLLKVSKNKYFD